MISVLVPIYAVEKYIERCARSLFEQTYNDIEYIFVNDCSPDRSVDILKQIIPQYPQRVEQVKIINHIKNRGLAAARNTAVSYATGDFILHVDSDDYLEYNAVEKLVEKQKETQADIVTGQSIQHTTISWFIMERPQFAEKKNFIQDMIKPTIHHTIWGRLIRKSLYIDNQIKVKEDINIGEDMQVMTQLAYYGNKFVSIPDIVYHYDTRNMESYMNSSTKNRKKISRLIQDKESIKIVYNFFLDNDPSFIPEISQYLSDCLMSLMKEYCLQSNKCGYDKTQKELKKFCNKHSFKRSIASLNYYIFKFLLYLLKK